MIRFFFSPLLVLLFTASVRCQINELPGTKTLTAKGDLSAQMLDGMETFLKRETSASVEKRTQFWKRDFTSPEAYDRSVEPNRRRLRTIIGAVDERKLAFELEYVGGTTTPSKVAETDLFTVYAVRWPVLEGVDGEGLLLEPRGKVKARVVAIPDADQTPELITGLAKGLPQERQWARRLAEAGCQVIVPVLIDRKDTWSGNPRIVMTNCPHREWVYRAGFDLGRHIIGYEVQKVLALMVWLKGQDEKTKIGIAGYGEGGLIALHAAAVDRRFDAVVVSGYFAQREDMSKEPIYRNVWGLLREFGDADIAGLIAPRSLIVEYSDCPKVAGPPNGRQGRRVCAAPGFLQTPSIDPWRAEIRRTRELIPDWKGLEGVTQGKNVVEPLSDDTLLRFLMDLGVKDRPVVEPGPAPKELREAFAPARRQQRQLQQLVDHTQKLLARSDEARKAFWSKAKDTSLEDWQKSCAEYREYLAEEVIGRFPDKRLPINPRSRKIVDKDKWTGHEVMLDVLPDVFLWGYLLVPKDIKPSEKRPVVVCQHGLEGLPEDVINEDKKSQAYGAYKAFGARLVERGFIVFAPHHYYRGGNRFRQLQRLAYPLKKTLFAFVVAQHEQLHDWLATLPFVDPARVGFYGLSYGGFSAQRLPALVTRYALSINSAEFNDMAMKKASVNHAYSYPFHQTYEVNEWNLANTFGYSDLAGLIAPRPFMVERGHDDGVAPDEWVASEYAKVRRRYVKLGIGDRTAIEWFDGPHTINGVGTFQFLHKHLKWPEPKK